MTTLKIECAQLRKEAFALYTQSDRLFGEPGCVHLARHLQGQGDGLMIARSRLLKLIETQEKQS